MSKVNAVLEDKVQHNISHTIHTYGQHFDLFCSFHCFGLSIKLLHPSIAADSCYFLHNAGFPY